MKRSRSTITPLKGWRAAKYLQTSVSGMIVPEEMVQRLKNAEDPKREGVDWLYPKPKLD